MVEPQDRKLRPGKQDGYLRGHLDYSADEEMVKFCWKGTRTTQEA
jgi:hypothetical protein